MKKALLATVGALAAAVLAVAPAGAATADTGAGPTAAAPGPVTQGFGYYAVSRGSLGIYNTPYTTIASVASAGGQNTLTISGTYSVAKAATFTTGITIADISANLGYSQTTTQALTVGCSYNTNGAAGVLNAYPRSDVIAYDVYERNLGGGGGNDTYVGSGQFNQPVGFTCQFDAY